MKCLEHLRQSYGEYKGRLMEETGKQSYLDTEMEFFAEYNYDAYREYKEALLDCARKETEQKALEEAQKHNQEYMELSQRVGVLQEELQAVEAERSKVYENKSEMQTLYMTNKNSYEAADERMNAVQKDLKKYEACLLYTSRCV